MTVQRALPPSTMRVLFTAAGVMLMVAVTGLLIAIVLGFYGRLLWVALLAGWKSLG